MDELHSERNLVDFNLYMYHIGAINCHRLFLFISEGNWYIALYYSLVISSLPLLICSTLYKCWKISSLTKDLKPNPMKTPRSITCGNYTFQDNCYSTVITFRIDGNISLTKLVFGK